MASTSIAGYVVLVEESSDEDESEITADTGSAHQNDDGPGPSPPSSLRIQSQSNQNQAQHAGNYDDIAQAQSQSADIRSRIESARLLLQAAELQSRPESESNGGSSNSSSASTSTGDPRFISSNSISNPDDGRLGLIGSRYAISRNVTPNDFYRESALASLCDVASVLKNRLSVERIYNLGPPQSQEERNIFDELLMTRFSDLITGEQGANMDRFPHGNTTGSDITAQSNPSHSQQRQRPLPLETNLSVDLASNSSANHSSSDTNAFDSSRMLDTVRNLRRHIEQSPESVVGNEEMVNAVTEFIQCLKQSSVISSAIAISPSTTPSKPRKRQRYSENSGMKVSRHDDASDDEEESCTICLEPWTTGGDHRICCLKCGHMFGYSCISKWIAQAHSCPQCKTPAKKDDIRNLFARKLTAEDTSERDRAMRLLEEERTKARSLEHKEALARREIETQSKSIETLEAQLIHLAQEYAMSTNERPEGAVGAISGGGGRPVVSSTSFLPRSSSSGGGSISGSQSGSPRNSKYHLLAKISITQDGNCRVFEHSKDLGMVVVSTKSPNPLFRGFGIKTLARDFRVLSYQPLHSALIRDLSFRPNSFDGTLLSCAMDKVVQLTSVTSKCVIQKFTLDKSAWCCAWNTTDNNLFYVGMERGQVKEFDVRRTDGPVQDVLDLGGPPIVSVSYLDAPSSSNTSSIKGLLIGQLRNLIFREKRGEEFYTHALPCPQAPIMGSCFIPDGHFLSSFRPTSTNARCQYEVSRLMRGREDNLFSHKFASWEGATLQPIISRNCLFIDPHSERCMYAATANQQSNTVSIWDVHRGREHQSLNCFNKAYDIKTISSNHQDLLGVLSDSDLVLYKWQKDSFSRV